jgi:hypothetical protein
LHASWSAASLEHVQGSKRALRTAVAAVSAVCLAWGVWATFTTVDLGPDPAAGATAATGTVGGTVWRDQDGDGRRDAGEPGVSRVVIGRNGTSVRAVTASDGTWSLTLPAGSVTLTALTGWLPSACPGDLHCKAGRTADQDFAVENQFVRSTVTVVAGARTTLDLGLLPDHGDPTGSPTSANTGNDPGDGVARGRDLAVRHSAPDGYVECADPSGTRGCPVGTTLRGKGQLFNQGIGWATEVRFVLVVPPGVSIASDPVRDSLTPGPALTRTGRTGCTSVGGKWVEFAAGSLAPAQALLFNARFRIDAGPRTTKPLTTDYDHQVYVSISGAANADDDAPMLVDPNQGKDRGHNVNWPRALDDDTSDAIEFNVT